jgi:M-phase inducer tyrosine phosphatase
MQSSSPLAAMHRPSVPHMFERNPLGNHYATTDKGNPVAGPLRQRQIQRATQLFGADIRGSSPAASLCADLSQNLGLDNEARCVFVFDWWRLLMDE